MTKNERRKKADELLSLLHAAPAQIADLTMFAVKREFHIDPARLDEWLSHIGHPVEDGVSTADVVKTAFGQRAVELIEELI